MKVTMGLMIFLKVLILVSVRNYALKDFSCYAVNCGDTVVYCEQEDKWHYWWTIFEKVDCTEAEVVLSLPRSFDFKGHPLYGVSSYEEEAMIILMGLGD